MKTFELKNEHIMIARRLNIGWSDKYFGTPYIDVKRPYQDSDVLMSIADIIGLDISLDDSGQRYLTKEQKNFCEQLHREMHIAISVMLASADFKPGVYQTRFHNIFWEPVTLGA